MKNKKIFAYVIYLSVVFFLSFFFTKNSIACGPSAYLSWGVSNDSVLNQRCLSGTETNFISNVNGWTWNCPQDSAPSSVCSAYIQGVCGSANNRRYTSTPTSSSLCSAGVASSVSVSSSFYSWDCGIYQGLAHCSAYRDEITYSCGGQIPTHPLDSGNIWLTGGCIYEKCQNSIESGLPSPKNWTLVNTCPTGSEDLYTRGCLYHEYCNNVGSDPNPPPPPPPPPPPGGGCTPNCSHSSSYCLGVAFSDGCNGICIGTASCPTVSYDISATTPIMLGESTTITYTVKNAASCIASTYPEGAGNWSGIIPSNDGTHVINVTPTTSGVKHYAITCSDILLGFPPYSTEKEAVVAVDVPSIVSCGTAAREYTSENNWPVGSTFCSEGFDLQGHNTPIFPTAPTYQSSWICSSLKISSITSCLLYPNYKILCYYLGFLPEYAHYCSEADQFYSDCVMSGGVNQKLCLATKTTAPITYSCINLNDCSSSENCGRKVSQTCMSSSPYGPVDQSFCNSGAGCPDITCPACPSVPSKGGWKEVAP